MFVYEKKLQYPVRIANPNPQLAAVIISQYGGPDGELGASLRYLSQRYAMPYPELSALLTDIGTEAAKMAAQVPRDAKRTKNGQINAYFFVKRLKSTKGLDIAGDMH